MDHLGGLEPLPGPNFGYFDVQNDRFCAQFGLFRAWGLGGKVGSGIANMTQHNQAYFFSRCGSKNGQKPSKKHGDVGRFLVLEHPLEPWRAKGQGTFRPKREKWQTIAF